MKKRLTFHQLLFEQQILGILLFTVLVVFLWIVSSIYFSYSASTLTQDDNLTVEPLNPAIPDQPLQELNSRTWWSDAELNQFSVSFSLDQKTVPAPVTATQSATPLPTLTPVSTSSATPTVGG